MHAVWVKLAPARRQVLVAAGKEKETLPSSEHSQNSRSPRLR
jgi:hypothetical protein